MLMCTEWEYGRAASVSEMTLKDSRTASPKDIHPRLMADLSGFFTNNYRNPDVPAGPAECINADDRVDLN